MQARRERITELGATVVFVACDESAEVEAKLVQGVDLAFPIGIDPEARSYAAWSLGRTPWWRIVLDPSVWWRYARLLAAGERLRGGGADTLQMGGDFVVASDGTLAYARPQTRNERPPVGELLAAIQQLTSGGPS